MNKNMLIPAAIASTVVGALMLTGCASEPSDGFKKHCKAAEGTIERENDNTLGMSSVGFGVPKPVTPVKPAAPAFKAPVVPKPAQKAPVVPKVPTLPKNDAPKSDKTKTPQPTVIQTVNGNGLAFGKSKKRKAKGHDDNDFLCVKDGVLLFEEDE